MSSSLSRLRSNLLGRYAKAFQRGCSSGSGPVAKPVALHDRKKVGTFFSVDDQIVNRLDPFRKCFEPTFRPTLQACACPVSLILRPVMVELTDHILRIPTDCPNLRYVLYGTEPGVGKSSVLFYALLLSVHNNGLIVHFPKASELMRQQIRRLEANARRSDRYDTSIEAVEWLQNFATQNRAILEDGQLKTSREYVWSSRETTAPDTNVLSIIQFATDRIRYASDCVGIIVKEIKEQSAKFGFKILVAFDGVNAYYGSTWLRSTGDQLLTPDDLVMVHAAKKLLKPDWTNAVTVCTVSPEETILEKPLGKRWTKRQKRRHYRQVRLYNEYYYDGPCTPLALLQFTGFHDLDPFIPMEVPKFNDQEVNQYLNFYDDKNWIADESACLQENIKVLKFLSGNNPSELSKLLSFI